MVVFENVVSGKVLVIYVGVQTDTVQDVVTDAQHEVVKRKLERLKQLYSDNVKFVGRNSLAGGLALYSSIGIDGIEVITFNLELVAADYKDIILNNAFNSISKNDPLFLVYSNTGMMNRIPGQPIKIYS